MRGAKRWLGSECDALVFDAHDGFDPDALGAAAGTVRAAGSLLLLTPPLGEWATLADPVNDRVAVHGTTVDHSRYLARCARLLPTLPCDLRDADSDPVPEPGPKPKVPAPPSNHDNGPGRPTADQQQLIDSIIDDLSAPGACATVVQADRGRGKSAALGQLAAALAKCGRRVTVTAPRRCVCDTLFKHAAQHWPTGQKVSDLAFIAPDQAHTIENPDVLLVDEAGGLHLGLTRKLLQHWQKVVFAGTVHGYEGAGRGFRTRFETLISGLPHRTQEHTLTVPLRWPENDPLETSVNTLLMLDAECSTTGDQSKCRWLDRDALSADETPLRALYALLATAHYRTRPLDLRQLLDGPNLRIAVIEQGGQPTAAALVADEGEFTDRSLVDDIAAGKRRPRGHLLPQLLTWQYQEHAACEQRWWRVVRIAVHPDRQRNGLGSELLAWLRSEATSQSVDALCTSFGADPTVLPFWQRANFSPVYLGHVREATSGAFALAMVHPLSQRGHDLHRRVSFAFKAHRQTRVGIESWLNHYFASLDDSREN